METIHITSISYYIPGGRLTKEDILKKVKQANKKHLEKDE